LAESPPYEEPVRLLTEGAWGGWTGIFLQNSVENVENRFEPPLFSLTCSKDEPSLGRRGFYLVLLL